MNMFSHLRASTSVNTQRNAGVEKFKLSHRPASTLQRRTNQNRLFFTWLHVRCNFPCTPVQTYVAMDEEKLIEAVCSFPSLWKVTMKSYKDVKAKENAWKEVAIRVVCVL